MYRTAFRSLFVAAALLLTTTACDSGDAKKTEDAKKTDDTKVDGADATKKEGGEAPTTAVEPAPEPPPEADPVAEAGEPAAAEAGEAEAEEPEAEEPEAEEPEPSKTEKAPTEKAPAEKTAKIDGKPIFDGKCKSCHGADGKGDTTIGKKVDIPSLAGTSLSKAKVVAAIADGVSGTKMKAYKDKLSKDEIDAVAAYVKKL